MAVETGADELSGQDILRLSAEIVAAYVSRNAVQPQTIKDVVRSVHGALQDLSHPAPAAPNPRQKPSVPVSRSVQPDFIVCLEDG